MKVQQGFIFLITLLITTVISLLVLTSMQHLLLYYKVANRQKELHQNFYQLESVASQLAHKKYQSIESHCVIQQDSANQVMHKLLHCRGCFLNVNGLSYQYVIEDLGAFPCLISNVKGQKHTTYHRRISVVSIANQKPISFLQIRFIAPGSGIDCVGKEHLVNLGVSSWRYVAAV